MTDLLSISGLCKTYGDFALQNMALCVPEGCVTGFIGSNGSGKTTTIKALLGLVRREAGSIELFGRKVGVEGPDPAEKDRIGVVLDTCPFPELMKVRDVEAIGRRVFVRWGDAKFENLIGEFGIDLGREVKSLSRGMGMKLQLAFALAHEPRLLVLDEATAGFDPLARDEALDLLREFMADGHRGILMSSHITSDLEKIADWVVCIDDGRKVFERTLDEIRDVAGVARCKAAEADALAESGLFEGQALHLPINGYSIDVLVPDRMQLRRAFPEIACDRPTLEEYMTITLKGVPL